MAGPANITRYSRKFATEPVLCLSVKALDLNLLTADLRVHGLDVVAADFS